MFPIPGLPSPWIIVGFLLALIGAYVTGNVQGHKAERASWAQAMVDQEREVARVTARAEKDRREAEQKYAKFKDEVEKQHADNLARINGLRIANGRLVAASGGLFDRNGRPSGQDGMPGSAAAPGGAATAAAGCRLSESVTGDLLDLARDADAAAVYAQTGHAYAIGIPR